MATVIIGAGAGGLAAAIALAAKGEKVTVLEAQSGAGGKMLPVLLNGAHYDSGPTVLTMRWVFDLLFALCEESLDALVTLHPLTTLARHYWSEGQSLDLFADHNETMDAIGRFAGCNEAESYKAFASESKRIHNAMLQPFLKSQRPTPWGLASALPIRELFAINPFETYWHALGRYFKNPKLRQLFGRYATYCGSSPFKAPATLMLVADVEACGVWRVEGGMRALVRALQLRAEKSGVLFHFNCAAARVQLAGSQLEAVIDAHGNRHMCSSVIVNADSAALSKGLFGEDVRTKHVESDPSLSAITWCAETEEQGVHLEHHTVFFSDDYEKEFAELAQGAANDPTVYVCDQGQSRKLLLVNAPATAQSSTAAIDSLMLRRLEKSGLNMKLKNVFRRDTRDFATLYPATQGALYGGAAHGWLSTFRRPQARTKIPGLYLAGGSTHPGPGVPMAALSGLRAAEALCQDRALM